MMIAGQLGGNSGTHLTMAVETVARLLVTSANQGARRSRRARSDSMAPQAAESARKSW